MKNKFVILLLVPLFIYCIFNILTIINIEHSLSSVEKSQSVAAMRQIAGAVVLYRESKGRFPQSLTDLCPSIFETPGVVIPNFMRRNLGLDDSKLKAEIIDALGVWRIVPLEKNGKRFAIVGSSNACSLAVLGDVRVPVAIAFDYNVENKFLTKGELVELIDSSIVNQDANGNNP